MFSELMSHPDLYGIVRSSCWENNVGIVFSEDLLSDDGYPLHDRVLVLKLDEYYSSQRMHNPPPSVDCLVLVRCLEGDAYNLFLVELRNTKLTTSVRARDIKKKFDTAVFDFIKNRFQDIFLSDRFHIAKIELFLVTDPLRLVQKNISEEEARKLYRGTVLDAYSGLEPLEAFGRYLQIKPILPNPAIKSC
jgi:hypothetical protein